MRARLELGSPSDAAIVYEVEVSVINAVII